LAQFFKRLTQQVYQQRGKRNQVVDWQAKNLQTYDSNVKIMSKKYHLLNWQHGKIITFIQAKKDQGPYYP
jgi:hypothetical protein